MQRTYYGSEPEENTDDPNKSPNEKNNNNNQHKSNYDGIGKDTSAPK